MPCNGKKYGDDDVITTTTENVSTGDEQTAKPTTSGKRQPAAAVRQRPQLGLSASRTGSTVTCSAIHVYLNCLTVLPVRKTVFSGDMKVLRHTWHSTSVNVVCCCVLMLSVDAF